MEPICLLYTTFASQDDAAKILSKLIKEKLATCGNIGMPHLAIYPWKGDVQQEPEVGVLIKAPEHKREALIKRLQKLHPYELPCIVALEAGAIPEYAAWLEKP